MAGQVYLFWDPKQQDSVGISIHASSGHWF